MARRILLITERYPPHAGGLSRASQRLAGHLASLGHETHVLVVRDELAPAPLTSSAEGPVVVHRLAAHVHPADTGQAASQAIEWLQEQHRFHLLHGQYGSGGGFLAALHARRFGIAGYVSLRGNDLDRDIHDPTRAPHLLWALRHAHAVGGVSRALVSDAAAISGRDDILYTPNSVDAEQFVPVDRAAARQRLGVGDGPVVGFVGELRHKKGGAFILEAFRSLPPEWGTRLLLAGSVRAEQRHLLQQFREDHPEPGERIHLSSYQHQPGDLVDAYAAMDVLLSPSLWEGMPNAVLEAMACARPVLASDAGGHRDLILPGETGWVLSRHHLHRLGEALQEVLELPGERREEVGAAGRRRVQAEFTPERERRELEAAHRQALERGLG